MTHSFVSLIREVRDCTNCVSVLPQVPRPVFQVSQSAKLLIAGQAPGLAAHNTGIPFNDRSGIRLREWLGVDADTFYDASRVNLLPMAFCYPGTGDYGDLPPPKQCAKLWRTKILNQLPNVELTVVCGGHALTWYFQEKQYNSLTEIVRNWRQLPSEILVLPHPSPRNNGWLKNNKWFEMEVLPELKQRVASILD